MTILLSFLNFGPYHLARLAEAQRLAERKGVKLCGLEMARVQSEYAWGEIAGEGPLCASPKIPLEKVPAFEWKSYLTPVLEQVAPDVCAIAGYSHPSMLSLILLCEERGIPWVIMSDSREVDLPRKPWREWMKTRVVGLASSGFAAGRMHMEYLTKLGLPAGACFSGYDVVDNERFASEAAKWRVASAVEEGRASSPPYFLSSSRFIPEKNLFRLLGAYACYRAKVSGQPGHESKPRPRSLCLLGDGELKTQLVKHAADLELKVVPAAPWEVPAPEGEVPVLYLPGFRQINELPRFYAHADAAILASTKDTWGLVVNEAMATSLPVIVSNRCGSAPELVKEGVNGYTFDPFQIEELVALMERLAELSPSKRQALGEAGKRIIDDWGLDRFSSGLLNASAKAMEVGAKRATCLDRFLLKGLIVLGSQRS